MASYEERRLQSVKAHQQKGQEARRKLCYCSKVAERAERYEDIIRNVKNIIKIATQREKGEEGAELRVEERNLMSVAYKNVVGKRRSSWRTLTAIRNKYEKHEQDDAPATLTTKYIEKIEDEIVGYCLDIQAEVDKLFPLVTSNANRVFYRKLAADYERYLCEIYGGEDLKRSSEKALVYYKLAAVDADKHLHPTDPIRLSVALNFSVYYYETLRAPDRACHLARAAFDDALAELDTLPEMHYKDSTILLQLLRDNLQKWANKDDFGPIIRGAKISSDDHGVT